MSAELPTKLPDPPRRVVRRDAGCIVGAAYVMIVLIMLLALVPAGYMVLSLVYALGGTETVGETVEFIGSSKSRTVDFVYIASGEKRQDYERVSKEVLAEQKARHDAGNKNVKVRYVHAGPVKIAGLPELASVWWVPGRALLFLSITAAVVWLLYWAAFKVPRREKELVATGIATIGVIADKRIYTGSRSQIYFVKFLYTGPSGAQWTSEVAIRGKRRWEAIPIGEVVTVLVDPKDERRCTVYEYSLMKVKQ